MFIGLRHLKDVKLTFFEHALFSLKLALNMSLGAFCATIHAFLPGLFITSSTDITNRLAQSIQSIHNISKPLVA